MGVRACSGDAGHVTRRADHDARLAVLVVPVALLLHACATNNDTATETTTTAATATQSTTEVDPTTTAATISAPTTTVQESSTTTAPLGTPPASTTNVDDVAPCRRLTDFDDATDWFIVNDGVMGGRSNGLLSVSGSSLAFSGTVVTEGGGFTSVRYRLDGSEMTGSTHLSMRVRADDRVYGVTLEDEAEVGGRSVSHRADIDTNSTVDDDGWMIATVDYAVLTPSVFGRQVDAPPFNPAAAQELGIIIADGLDGDFSMEVDWIDVCA